MRLDSICFLCYFVFIDLSNQEKTKGLKMPRKKTRKKSRNIARGNNFVTVLSMNDDRLAKTIRQIISFQKGDWDLLMDVLQNSFVYRVERISKGIGKPPRIVHAPNGLLKKVQRKILNRFLSEIPTHSARHGGGQKGTSNKTNALEHQDNAYAFSTDIMNAFPSILRSRVRACLKPHLKRVLSQFRPLVFEFEEKRDPREKPTCDGDIILEGLIDLLVFDDRLPQGPPSSPRLLDIVSYKMDCDLWRLAQESSNLGDEYVYTAYVDDLSFSSAVPIPEEVQQKMLTIVRDNGFHPHHSPEKTKYHGPDTGSHPVITGILIRDGMMHLPTRKQNQLRARLHNLNVAKEAWSDNERGEAAGLLGFIRQIYPLDSHRKLPSKLKDQVLFSENRLQQRKVVVSETPFGIPVAEEDVITKVCQNNPSISDFNALAVSTRVGWTSHSGIPFTGTITERFPDKPHLAQVTYLSKGGKRCGTRLKCQRLTVI